MMPRKAKQRKWAKHKKREELKKYKKSLRDKRRNANKRKYS